VRSVEPGDLGEPVTTGTQRHDGDRKLSTEGPRGALADTARRLAEAIGPHESVEGWATVDLDRAESNIPGARSREGLSDELLGARSRWLDLTDGNAALLLEPSTEGRLAASLARFGEGPIALYLRPEAGAAERAIAAGFALSTEAGGPLGRQRLVLGGPRWGPHVLLVEPATIGR
jgi:hypothetical protein